MSIIIIMLLAAAQAYVAYSIGYESGSRAGKIKILNLIGADAMKIEKGKKYKTRSGKTVKIVSVDDGTIFGTLDGKPETWLANGKMYYRGQSPDDITEEK